MRNAVKTEQRKLVVAVIHKTTVPGCMQSFVASDGLKAGSLLAAELVPPPFAALHVSTCEMGLLGHLSAIIGAPFLAIGWNGVGAIGGPALG